ncbi:universal stress protein [Natronosalvus halobius]|uniref:universal stress protein n=1 Tax=Natronosalvus halobius TaxID=2953746 RepID=UPI00209CECD9|nr:universal stress protein [Natronosalvus halobius]USZ71936.1 universal stress protein [Natronosalvus halobius]
MSDEPFRRVLVPIANEEDARVTGKAVADRFDDAILIPIYVVEKAGGAPDAAGVEQREEFAETLFKIFEAVIDGPTLTVEPTVGYGTDVAATIIEVADDERVDTIVFVPRSESRWRQLLTGDVARKLINRTDRPVLILPGDPDE